MNHPAWFSMDDITRLSGVNPLNEMPSTLMFSALPRIIDFAATVALHAPIGSFMEAWRRSDLIPVTLPDCMWLYVTLGDSQSLCVTFSWAEWMGECDWWRSVKSYGLVHLASTIYRIISDYVTWHDFMSLLDSNWLFVTPLPLFCLLDQNLSVFCFFSQAENIKWKPSVWCVLVWLNKSDWTSLLRGRDH